MDGRQETWVDRAIREATDRGAFDDLPGAGKPLAFLDQPQDENWWIRGFLQREQLDAGVLLPPRLALRREREKLLDALADLPTERSVRAVAEDFNDRVRECLRRPVQGPPVVVRTVDVDSLVARWAATRPAAPAPPPGTTVGTPSPQHSWARRAALRLTRGRRPRP